MNRRLTARLAIAALAAALAGWGAASISAGAAPPPDPRPLHEHPSTHQPDRIDRQLAKTLARARVATAKYANDVEAAKADGYRIITPMIEDMGIHYLNPAIEGFDVERPQILVYEKRGDSYQLGALEWVFPKRPARPPLKGARYGSFGAACHYDDGSFVFARSEDDCESTSPESGSPFVFWHPKLVTLHVWAWYPNPDGLYNGTNPLVRPFNRG
jgi:hypothetical protein